MIASSLKTLGYHVDSAERAGAALEAMKRGAFDYLVKLFSLDTLQHKVERVLEYRKFINLPLQEWLHGSIRSYGICE